MLVNENRLNLADPRARKYLEEQMRKHFFGEGADRRPGSCRSDKRKAGDGDLPDLGGHRGAGAGPVLRDGRRLPKDERTEDRTGGVKTAEAEDARGSRAGARRDGLELGKRLRARGHVILDLIQEHK